MTGALPASCSSSLAGDLRILVSTGDESRLFLSSPGVAAAGAAVVGAAGAAVRADGTGFSSGLLGEPRRNFEMPCFKLKHMKQFLRCQGKSIHVFTAAASHY